jgi:hypothetical protein
MRGAAAESHNRARARSTVLLDQGAPVGVAMPRALSSAAAAASKMPLQASTAVRGALFPLGRGQVPRDAIQAPTRANIPIPRTGIEPQAALVIEQNQILPTLLG